jgi:1,4-alpha-glucan branching enzyme
MDGTSTALVVSNFTPTVYFDYRVGVPASGYYAERLNTDAERYGGSNVGNFGGLRAHKASWNGQPYSITLSLPPLATVIFELQRT